MTDAVRTLFASYLRQQAQLGIPGYFFGGSTTVQRLDEPDELLSESLPSNATAAAPAPGVKPEDKREALKTLYFSVRTCTTCPLAQTRKKLVFGAGSAAASVMVIGEAPGAEEDRQGLPFVGPAGALLTKMLTAIKLDRTKDVFVTNVVKCRPPENRDPNDAEIASCQGILARQIEVIAPKAILVLGRVAAHTLLGIAEPVGALRQQLHNYKGIPVVVTYHPAALLRREEYKRPAWEDLQKLERLLGG